MLRKISLTLALLALMVVSIVPSITQASFTPYYGKEYSQPEQVLKLYPEPDVEFHSPAFEKEEKQFTTQEEMMAFLRQLDEKSNLVEMKVIGESIEGRKIPMLVFNKGAHTKNKPTVWLQAQIHGNEPAAGESALVMANKLSGEFGEKILDKVNVIIVPRVNPDGSYYYQRRTANGLDANRDHIKLELQENRAVHRALKKFHPEVVIQAHEYGVPYFPEVGNQGGLTYHDITLLTGRNLNIPEKIRNMANELYIGNTLDTLTDEGFSSRTYYYPVGRKDGKTIIQEGGTDPRIGRNAFGLQPSFSFLVESRGIGIGRENFKRRVAGQITSHMSILETTADNAKKIKKIVFKAKKHIVKNGRKADDNDKIVVESKRKVFPNETLTVVDTEKGETVEIPVIYYSSLHSIPTLVRERPTAYIVPPEYEEVAEKLKIQGVEVKRLRKPVTLEVEGYTVTEQNIADEAYEGHYLNNVETEITTKKVHFPKGSYVYSMAQPQANLIAVTLEPESNDSYVTFNYIPADLGDQIPVYRYMQQKQLNVSTVKE
ncbi:M14 family metallopeptidase [Pseudalkalibacillus decolorationis]|uniref:M14 family metallopeptidase n=1 Tax=Pseudalkalibacillus decolorationis TaxID=163879 RepID=UPI002148B63C|nr:M14 family metallocarboxypeptidase [Pseudalkalibacillus decolorationis]